MILSQQQSALLTAIFAQTEFSTTERSVSSTEQTLKQSPGYHQGLEVYQRSLLANANRALQITFASVHSFVGEKVFQQLVKTYVQTKFKTHYDWGEFGVCFPQFIAGQTINNAQLIASVAELDYACHQCERSKNSTPDFASFKLLAEQDPYQLSITLSAGARVFTSPYPLDTIISNIRQLAQENSALSHEDVHRQVSHFAQQHRLSSIRGNDSDKIKGTDEGHYYYLLWRPHFQAQYTLITPADYQWLQLWLSGDQTPPLSLGQALDIVSEDFSIVDWLPKAIEQQLINAVHLRR